MLFSLVGSRSEPQSQKVFITSGKIDQMITIFSRTWQRQPTAEELDGLIEDEIREQVLYREAMAMGLDKDDTIVRRRLRQKFEFLMEDVEAVSVPTDRDLQDWVDKNPGKFSTEPKFSFLQIYLNVNRRGEDASAEATNLLARLNNTDEKVNASELGDATLLHCAGFWQLIRAAVARLGARALVRSNTIQLWIASKRPGPTMNAPR